MVPILDSDVGDRREPEAMLRLYIGGTIEARLNGTHP